MRGKESVPRWGWYVAVFTILLEPVAMTGCCVAISCTLLPCTDGLEVFVEDVNSEAATIQVLSSEGQREAVCNAGSICLVVFDGFHPTEPTIRVIWSGGTFEVTEQPQYEKVQPNGSCCGPTCRTGRIAVNVQT